MAEHIKGKLKLEGKYILAPEDFHTNGRQRNSVGISSASYSDVIAIIHGDLELPIPKAYAEELIRRWNAFEEGGLVEKLVGACEKLIEANEYARAISLRNEAPRGTLWNETRSLLDTTKLKARQALAEAKKCIEE